MKRILIVGGAVVVLVLVIIAIPAQTFALLLDDYDIHLLDARGTVWRGSAQLVVPGTNLGTLQWNIVPQRLLRANLTYDVSVTGSSVQARGTFAKGFSKTSLFANAEIQPSIVNSILLHYEMKISGSIQLHDVDLLMNGRNEISSLSGSVEWEGGKSRYRAGDEVREIDLPAMNGSLIASEGDVILTAMNGQDDTELLNARLEAASGWLHIGLSRQMIELAKMRWDAQGSPGSEVFKVSRQIFR
ncbi:MAG: type II secretion system protein N [Gammaproteobacteria bacterium]|nr:type II secretion system protein N [Gammaproteobacteria bacterium]